MAYRICRPNEIEDCLKRVAREQIDKAIDEIGDQELDRHETVHQVRKRYKKLRGLIRLVRPEFEAYRRENDDLRDAAAELSFVRDSQSMIECLDDLLTNFQDQIDHECFVSVRERLSERRREIVEDQVGLEKKLSDFLSKTYEIRERINDWGIDEDGFAAVRGGLTKTYRRAKKGLDLAYRTRSSEDFHEWRKRVKYHWYHMRLLRLVWPPMMAVRRRGGDRLSDLLGDDHDLAVLRETLLKEPDGYGDRHTIQALVGLIDRRSDELRALAKPLGSRLFAEKPKRFAARLEQYWQTWERSADLNPQLDPARLDSARLDPARAASE